MATQQTYAHREILVADDEEVVTQFLAQMIRTRLGARVDVVYDGQALLSALEKKPYDLLLTDMLMPGGRGVDLVREVREKCPDLDVIVVTAFPERFPYLEVIEAGACDFIVKPSASAEIEAKLVRVLRERALREELARERQQVLRDMEELKQARVARSVAEGKYKHLFERSPLGMLVLEPGSCRIRDTNNSFCELVGRTKDDLLTRTLYDVVGSADRERVREGLDQFAGSGRGTIADVVVTRSDGNLVRADIGMAFITEADEQTVLAAFRDVTVERELHRQLAETALTDSVTELSNRRAFHIRVHGALLWASREQRPVSLLFMDLDNFKRCNDTFGHQIGDRVLRRVGEVIRWGTRAIADEGFRYGGDEFSVLMLGSDTKVAARVGERLQSQFGAGECHGTSLSIGIAEYEPGMDEAAFVRAADQALYQAKAKGRNVICTA